MAIINKYPYTDFENLNLDWIIAKVKEYIEKTDNFGEFLNESIEEQNALIKQALQEIASGMQDLRDYITDNLKVIANEIINKLIDSGELYIGTEYNAETEELNIVMSREENNG